MAEFILSDHVGERQRRTVAEKPIEGMLDLAMPGDSLSQSPELLPRKVCAILEGSSMVQGIPPEMDAHAAETKVQASMAGAARFLKSLGSRVQAFPGLLIQALQL